MKKFVLFVLIVAMLGTLAACGDEQDGAIATATPTPVVQYYRDCGGEVILGKYKGLEYEHISTNVTDKELEEDMKLILEMYPNYQKNDERTGTEVADGDFINIDYVGYMDEEAFENGSDKDFVLEIGSNTFIDGFEEGLIGKIIGETVEVPVTFPNPYQNNPDLAGKPAVFKVTINYACDVLDHMTDDYVAGYTDDEYKTVDTFKEALRKEMAEEKKNSKESAMWTALIDMVIENTEFKTIDKEDVDFYYNSVVESMEQTATMYGMTVEQLVMYYGGYDDIEEFYKEERENAETTVKQYMVLEAIVEAEKLTVTDEVYNTYITGYMEQVSAKDQAEFEATYGKDYIMFCMRNDLALEFLRDNAVITEPAGNETDTDEETDVTDDANDTSDGEKTEE